MSTVNISYPTLCWKMSLCGFSCVILVELAIEICHDDKEENLAKNQPSLCYSTEKSCTKYEQYIWYMKHNK